MLLYLLCILEKVYKIFFLYSTFIVIGKLMIYCFSWNRRDRCDRLLWGTQCLLVKLGHVVMSNSICVPHKLFNPITEVSIFASALCNPFTTMYFWLFSFSQLIWTVNITQMFRRHTALRFVLHTLQFSHLSVLRNPHFGVLQIFEFAKQFVFRLFSSLLNRF